MVLCLLGATSMSGVQNENSNGNSNSKNKQSKWTTAEIVMLTFAIIYLIFWLLMVVSAFTCTAKRGVSEKMFSIFWALLLPEVWLFAHGVDSAREGVSFFGTLPAIPFQNK
jgi:hypothetical protein